VTGESAFFPVPVEPGKLLSRKAGATAAVLPGIPNEIGAVPGPPFYPPAGLKGGESFGPSAVIYHFYAPISASSTQF